MTTTLRYHHQVCVPFYIFTQFYTPLSNSAGDLQFVDITNSSARVVWTIPFVSVEQSYTVLYGYSADTINMTAGTVQGNNLTNQTYTLEITELEQATTYYVQVLSTFDIYTLYSDVVQFTTRESRKYNIIASNSDYV